MLYPEPLYFSHIADYVYGLCPLPDPDVGLSILVCDVKHTSVHVGQCGRKFVLCMFGQCPGSTQELYTCLFRKIARVLLKRCRCLAYEVL